MAPSMIGPSIIFFVKPLTISLLTSTVYTEITNSRKDESHLADLKITCLFFNGVIYYGKLMLKFSRIQSITFSIILATLVRGVIKINLSTTLILPTHLKPNLLDSPPQVKQVEAVPMHV